jgi:small subunit ribosomal protein S13
MVRIAGIDLPKQKRVEYALTSIYGIGLTLSQKILDTAQINRDIRVNELKDTDIISLREVIENDVKVEEDLRRVIKQNILRLSQINCVRGRRHRAGLPLRGQRTRTNARTRKGKVKVVTGNKKK